MIDPGTKRSLFVVIVGLLSLAAIPLVSSYLAGLFGYEIGGTQLTPGLILGLLGLYVAWLLYKGRI